MLSRNMRDDEQNQYQFHHQAGRRYESCRARVMAVNRLRSRLMSVRNDSRSFGHLELRGGPLVVVTLQVEAVVDLILSSTFIYACKCLARSHLTSAERPN